MQRSSETIGTIAAALAKAQAELINPEKSQVATDAAERLWRGRTVIPLRAIVERPRHRTQDFGSA